MKQLRQLCLGLFLMCALSLPAIAGEMDTPGNMGCPGNIGQPRTQGSPGGGCHSRV